MPSLFDTFPNSISHDSGDELTRQRKWVLLSLRRSLSPDEVQNLLANVGLALTRPIGAPPPHEIGPEGHLITKTPDHRRQVNHAGRRWWVESSDGSDISEQTLKKLEAHLQADLEWIGPAYRFPGTEGQNGVIAIVPDTLLIEKSSTDYPELHQLFEQYGLIPNHGISKYLTDYYSYTLDLRAEKSVYQIRQELLRNHAGAIQSADLEFMPLFIPAGAIQEPFYGQQWSLPHISAPGIWGRARNGRAAIVAVLDQEGCDLRHPEFEGGLVTGATFDHHTVIIPGGDIVAGTTDDHGTNGAGIIGARVNHIGIRGLASKCRIMPVRFVHWESQEIAAAIRYATVNNADVINMSFGGDETNGDYLFLCNIVRAIRHASNRGVVLCAATMNTYSSRLYYPASDPRVIACGASDQNDRRCAFSNYGHHRSGYISVVAPGISILTTANNVAGTPLHERANGTSMAAPHVSALAALLISGYPNKLRGDPMEVRLIIEQGAFKPAGYVFSSHSHRPNGTWNDELGYGRIHAARSFEIAAGRLE